MILYNAKVLFDHGYAWWKLRILESACNFFNYMVTTEIAGYVHLKEAAKSCFSL